MFVDPNIPGARLALISYCHQTPTIRASVVESPSGDLQLDVPAVGSCLEHSVDQDCPCRV